MRLFKRNKTTVNIVIDDYVIRLVQNNGRDFESVKLIAERALPPNIIVNGRIQDELEFYDLMKELVQDWGIKNNEVRFFVPNSLVIIRTVDIPKEVKKEEWKQYINVEVGNTIHFPFKNPVIDIYTSEEKDDAYKVTVIAAPEEELIKYVSTFEDVSLKPTVVDVQALGVYRFYLHQIEQIDENKVFLFVEFNLDSMIISIFHGKKFEFHRYQQLNIEKNKWEATEKDLILEWNYMGNQEILNGEIYDQLNEIERLLNFYQFSLHQGTQAVTDIVLLGDFPNLKDIATRIQERYPQNFTKLTTENTGIEVPLSNAFIPALGLAIKGGS